MDSIDQFKMEAMLKHMYLKGLEEIVDKSREAEDFKEKLRISRHVLYETETPMNSQEMKEMENLEKERRSIMKLREFSIKIFRSV